jgi:DNA-directed RNA polymerase III subunit RPC2
MGYEADHLIASIVEIEEDFVAAMGPSLDECASLDVISRADAIQHMIPKIKRKTFGPTVGLRVSQEHDVLDFLSNSMIGHVLSPGGNMRMKALYIGLMIRRL